MSNDDNSLNSVNEERLMLKKEYVNSLDLNNVNVSGEYIIKKINNKVEQEIFSDDCVNRNTDISDNDNINNINIIPIEIKPPEWAYQIILDKKRKDHLLIKVKRIIINGLFKFINNKIKQLYNNDIGKGRIKKQLLKISADQTKNTNKQYNSELLNKTLGNIFSEKITGKITNYLPSRNEDIIKELKEEKDTEKGEYFNRLFNLTFFDCIKYSRGETENSDLNGFKKFSDLVKEDKNLTQKGDDYHIQQLKDYLNMYEYNFITQEMENHFVIFFHNYILNYIKIIEQKNQLNNQLIN